MAVVETQRRIGPLTETTEEIVAEFIGKNLGVPAKVLDAVMAIPGVKDLLGPTVTPMVEALARLAT